MARPIVNAQLPRALILAAVLIAGEAIGLFFDRGPSIVLAIWLGIAIVIGLGLIEGSRFAWVVSILVMASQLTGPWLSSMPIWVLGTAAVSLGCLMIHSSREFVWNRQSTLGSMDKKTRPVGLYSRAVHRAYEGTESLLARRPVINRKLLIRLALCVALLLILDAVLASWYEGSGSTNAVAEILSQAAYTLAGIAQLLLIAALAVAAYQWWRDGHRAGSNHSA